MIPEKVLEQHIAILGKTGSGKTYTAKGIAETILRQKKRLCVVDPTSVWWGLRSDSTGKKPAFPIVVFGGEHADVPLGQQHVQVVRAFPRRGSRAQIPGGSSLAEWPEVPDVCQH